MGIKISDMPNLTGSKLNDDSLLLIADLSGSTSDLQNRKLKVSTFNQIYSNNKSVGSLSSNNNFFGSEQDGDVSFLTSTTISSENNGEIVVKQYKSCSISLGATVTTSNPCRGLVIFCTGDLTIGGTLTMTAKGGGVGNKSTEFNYNIADTSLSFTTSSLGVQSWNFSPNDSVWYPKYKQNVLIRTIGSPTPSGAGTAGVYSCGSGGAGGRGQYWCPAPTTSPFNWGPYVQPGGSAGNGGTGTIFAGGGGGGGQGGGYCTFSVTPGSAAVFEVGGSGGSGNSGPNPNPTPSPINPGYSGGGGGAGYSAGSGGGGSPTPATSGTSGAGGLLIIIVRGNVSITGTISSNGSNGGPGGGGANGGGGGGSGGGRIIIVYGGTYSNAGTVQANGGSAGGPAYSGGAGAITIQKIDQ